MQGCNNGGVGWGNNDTILNFKLRLVCIIFLVPPLVNQASRLCIDVYLASQEVDHKVYVTLKYHKGTL